MIPPNLPIYLCGDFNFGELGYFRTYIPQQIVIQFCNILHDFSLCQLVQDPTRGGDVLDLVLTNNLFSVSNLHVCDNLPGTDHDAVQFTFFILPPKQHPIHCYLYNYKRVDFDKFEKLYHLFHGKWLSLVISIPSWWEKNVFLLLFLLMFLWYTGVGSESG